MARFPFDPSLIHIGLDHDGEYYEVELRYVSPGGFAAKVIQPKRLAGGYVLGNHVPAFALPTLRGYMFTGAIMPKLFDELRWQVTNKKIKMDVTDSMIKHWSVW